MTDMNVGAAGNEPKKPVQPGLITEHQVQEGVKVNADPTQRQEGAAGQTYTQEQAEALLNESFYNALGVQLTTFDEKGNAKKLEKAKTSAEVLRLEIEKTERQRQLLEVDLPQLKIEHVKGWFDGTKAIPKTDGPTLDDKIALIDESTKDVEGVVGKRYHAGTKADDKAMEDAAVEIDEDLLFRMINESDYDDGQKATLKEGLEQAFGMSMTELANEFGIHVNADGLQDLKEDGTRADVEAQLAILNQMLEDMPTDDQFKAMIKEREDNIVAHLGKDEAHPGRVSMLVKTKFSEIDAEREFGKKPEAELRKLQDADIKSYVELQKLELLKGSMSKVRAEVAKLQAKLNSADQELIQMEEFEEAANAAREAKLVAERDDYKGKVRDVRDTGVRTEKGATGVGKAERKDKKKDVYTQKVEDKTKSKVSTAEDTYQERLKAEAAAKKAKTEAGYAKNQSHVYRYIDNFFETKDENKIDKAKKDELMAALEQYALADADKLELIADWLKYDDQSGEPIKAKAKTKVKTETDMGQITPDDLLWLLNTVKGMDIELKTTKQKNEAKEAISKMLGDHQKGVVEGN